MYSLAAVLHLPFAESSQVVDFVSEFSTTAVNWELISKQYNWRMVSVRRLQWDRSIYAHTSKSLGGITQQNYYH